LNQYCCFPYSLLPENNY